MIGMTVCVCVYVCRFDPQPAGDAPGRICVLLLPPALCPVPLQPLLLLQELLPQLHQTAGRCLPGICGGKWEWKA